MIYQREDRDLIAWYLSVTRQQVYDLHFVLWMAVRDRYMNEAIRAKRYE